MWELQELVEHIKLKTKSPYNIGHPGKEKINDNTSGIYMDILKTTDLEKV